MIITKDSQGRIHVRLDQKNIDPLTLYKTLEQLLKQIGPAAQQQMLQQKRLQVYSESDLKKITK